MAALVLLVDTDRTALRRTDALLTEVGYLVAPASSFKVATELLHSVHPDLLIAAIRLGAFNGLQLAARSRLDYPQLPVIITHATVDPVLASEAARQGAIFVPQPRENPDFLRLVASALEAHRHAQRTIRRWPRKRVARVVEARLATASAHILDMSYGGLRLAFRQEQDLPAEFDVTLPSAGITVKAHRIWTSRSAISDEFWVGVVVADAGSSAAGQWRTFVDSL
jgi:DNA-binding NtrC family response regulator